MSDKKLNALENADDLQRYYVVEDGVDPNLVSEFEAEYRVSRKQMASLIGVSEKTYYNLMSESQLDTQRADRFLQVHKVFKEGRDTFMGESNFMDWLQTPQAVFNDRRPFDLLQSISGLEAVYAELFRIRYGVLA